MSCVEERKQTVAIETHLSISCRTASLLYAAAFTRPVWDAAWIDLIKSRGFNAVVNLKEGMHPCVHMPKKEKKKETTKNPPKLSGVN